MSQRRGFITGCQRSGTTLMRLILEAHPQVACLDEAEAYRLLKTDGASPGSRDDAAPLMMFKIPRFTEQLLSEEMSDPDYGRFPSFYHGEPVVFMVRDPLDVVASMISLYDGRSDENWVRAYARRIVEHKCADPVFAERHAEPLAALVSADWPDHLVGAFSWVYKTDSLLDYHQAGLPAVPVCYESLVKNPRIHLTPVVAALDLPWDDAMLGHHRKRHTQLAPDGRTIGLSDPEAPIHDRSVGRYVTDLSDRQIAEIMNIAGRTWRCVRELMGSAAPVEPT